MYKYNTCSKALQKKLGGFASKSAEFLPKNSANFERIFGIIFSDIRDHFGGCCRTIFGLFQAIEKYTEIPFCEEEEEGRKTDLVLDFFRRNASKMAKKLLEGIVRAVDFM